MTKTNHIAVAYGDGIGPEIMEAVLRVMQAAEVNLTIDVISIGAEQYRRNFAAGIPDSAWDTIKNTRIILKAPITTPQGKGYKSLNVTLRKTLGLYANVRPVISYCPFVKCNFNDLNLVIIRENEEDLYAGIEYRLTNELHESLKLITKSGSAKINKFAFDYALKNGRKKVSCFIKDNIMKIADGAFHNVFKDVAKAYPEITNEQMIIDIAAAKVAANPEQFDVIVTQNLYGDIISDIAAEVSGSVGLCGSANIGDEYAMFEAIHGSAPDIAGKNIANPTGLLNGALMMLNHLEEFEKAALIQNALNYTIEQGIHTADLYDEALSSKKVGTKEFADAVIANLGNRPEKLNITKAPAPQNLAVREITLSGSLANNVKRTLVGCDLFIDASDKTALQQAEELAELTAELNLNLQIASYKGLKIWPNQDFTGDIGDYIRCRFIAKNTEKTATHRDIAALLNICATQNINFIKSENLYLYDGELGFSQIQGE